jgi:hypothetical protein
MGGLNMGIRRKNDVGKQELSHEQYELTIDWNATPPALTSLEFTDTSILAGCDDYLVYITAWNKYILIEYSCGTVDDVSKDTYSIERTDGTKTNLLSLGMSQDTKFEINIVHDKDNSIARKSKRGGAAPDLDDLIKMVGSTTLGQVPYTFEMKPNGVIHVIVSDEIHAAFRKRVVQREGSLQQFLLLEAVRYALHGYQTKAAADKSDALSDPRFEPWLAVFENLGHDPLSEADHDTLDNVIKWGEEAIDALATERKSKNACKGDAWFMS